MTQVENSETIFVEVRRQWNDWQRCAIYRLSDIENLKWDWFSGGVGTPTPQPFVHGYVLCDGMISGELAHSCLHGQKPARIKVCITRTGNEKVWQDILQIVGPRPR